MSTFTSAAEAAAAWWAQQVGAPVYRIVDERSSPKERRDADFASMAMTMLAENHPISDAQGEKFVAALVPVINKLLGRLDWVSFGVDYGPDLELANAAEAAGISFSRFPWKTHMSITRNYVTAALGYGARHKLIWESPDWKRPPCGSHHYDDEGYVNPANEVCTQLKFHDGDCGEWATDPSRCQDCGGSYVDHYGRNHERLAHTWTPAAVSA